MSCSPGGLRLRDLVVEYARYRLRSCRDSSRLKFLYAIDHWRDFIGRDPTTEDLSDDAATDLLYYLVESAGLAPPSANMYGKKIRALWNFGARRGHVRVWPAFADLPVDESVPVAFSRVELERVFYALRTTEGTIADVPAGLWWHSLGLFLWDSGERIGASISARWVDLREGCLTIQAGARKGQAGRRRAMTYRLHPETIEAIERIRGRRDAIWPWTQHYSSLWNHLSRILDRAGITNDRRHKFHCFRRSVASWSQRGGLDASLLLGHTDRAVTERSYISPTVAHRPAACDVLFRPTP